VRGPDPQRVRRHPGHEGAARAHAEGLPVRRAATARWRTPRRLAALVMAAGVVAAAADAPAQSTVSAPANGRPFMPGVAYDPGIPTLRAVLGHEPGEVITTPEQIVVYLRALAQAAPDRARLIEYGHTWEGRPLVVLAVSSPARMARLDEVRQGMAKLADPRRLAAGEG